MLDLTWISVVSHGEHGDGGGSNGGGGHSDGHVFVVLGGLLGGLLLVVGGFFKGKRGKVVHCNSGSPGPGGGGYGTIYFIFGIKSDVVVSLGTYEEESACQ